MFAIRRLESEANRVMANVADHGFDRMSEDEFLEWIEGMPKRWQTLQFHSESAAWSVASRWARVITQAARSAP